MYHRVLVTRSYFYFLCNIDSKSYKRQPNTPQNQTKLIKNTRKKMSSMKLATALLLVFSGAIAQPPPPPGFGFNHQWGQQNQGQFNPQQWGPPPPPFPNAPPPFAMNGRPPFPPFNDQRGGSPAPWNNRNGFEGFSDRFNDDNDDNDNDNDNGWSRNGLRQNAVGGGFGPQVAELSDVTESDPTTTTWTTGGVVMSTTFAPKPTATRN